jgi:CRISPR-associated protein Csb2
MPWEKKGPADRALIFDTFVSVNRDDALYLGWPDAELSPADRQTLSRLLGNLSSLGRAESWACATLTEEVVDLDLAVADKDDSNPIRVFCPDPLSAFADEHYPTHDPKKLASGKVNPADYLFDCPRWHLCLDTETIHSKRWPTVPGSRWVNYSRTPEADGQTTFRKPRATTRRAVSVVRFLIDGKVLPQSVDTLPFAEAVRSIAMSMCPSPTLSGHSPDGQPMQNHTHAYYLPTSEEDDPRHLTHLTLFAKAGFNGDEIKALESLRQLTWPRGEKERKYQLRIVGIGQPSDFTAPIFARSADWISATPFVAHRFPKGDQKIEQVAMSLLQQLGSGAPAAVEIEALSTSGIPMREFKRSRRKDQGQQRLFARLRIRFEHPIIGPLVLGYGAHFGLGMFVPRIGFESAADDE